jgi:hypothetical protein
MASTARRRPPPYAQSWRPAETQFADAAIAHWASFKGRGLTRANATRRNRSVAIKLFRFIHKEQDDVAPGERMTEGDVFVAIEEYARDAFRRNRGRAGPVLSFGNWFREGADNVDKYLEQAGKKRGHASPAPHDSKAAEIQTAVKKTLEHHGWRAFADRATGRGMTIEQYAEDYAHTLKNCTGDRYANEHNWLAAIQQDMGRVAVLAAADRDALTTRARKALATHPDRPKPGALRETNMVFALVCATYSLHGDRALKRELRDSDARTRR